ncbi:CHAT domain-containing protein [Seonamhaeicola sp. MEBiC1930]|uniref:CHAT domain-containing protein n=1 Tax=Seonamhaeicola sp. MEBiC01930 TaxID=2976768 RepID=UPI00324ABC10
MFRSISFLVFTFFFITVSSQEDSSKISLQFKELIKEHEKNIKELYVYRGASLDWLKTGSINEEDLFRTVLPMYHKKVGILTYTHRLDTLYVNLLSGNYNYKERRIHISADDLQEKVNQVYLMFSSSFLNRAPKERGSKPSNLKRLTKKSKASFRLLNNILLPVDLGLETFDHLIIVPTFNIATLPFAAFKMGEEYLIDLMSYSIAPNLFELMLSNEQNKVKHNLNYRELSYFWDKALFVSNPQYPINLDWDFPDLPGAKDEVNNIINLTEPIDFKEFEGRHAIKDSILKEICEYDLIYFATHGISNSDSPMDHSFLVLADNHSEKSYLSLREIMNTRKKCNLKADLVVLSACQTGLGRSHQGGVIGLARAFQIAGANHVLMSLWNIDDQETGTIMKMFFEEMKTGGPLMPHGALRNAILKYKSEINDDPKYWAAFSVFGVPY